MRIHIFSVTLLAACSPDPEATVSRTAASAAAERSGAELYAAYCAVCHGANGDGQGVAQLDRPARSFAAGGFSFGNTVQALRRTIASGIAGTPMPGFGSVLSDDALTRLAQHVRSLGPETVPDAGDAALLAVEDRPRFVRGQLGPIVAGGPVVPRGLLAGTLDGLSWQYRIDDVRLLCVRQGDFVKRSDWTGRGGTPLEPLGRLIDTLDPGNAKAPFRDARGRPLRGALRSTRVDGADAVLRYALIDPDGGAAVATLEETCGAAQFESVSGYARRWTLDAPAAVGGRSALVLAINSATRSANVRAKDGTQWRRASTVGEARAFGIRVADSRGRPVPFELRVADGETLVELPAGEGPLRLELTTLLPPDADDATWSKIREELAR